MSRSIRGLRAPSQIGTCLEGAGPRFAPRTWWWVPSTASTDRSPVSQMPRMTSMPSARASTAWPGVSRVPPYASIASQKPPAPSPSATRPPLSRSRLATDLASTAGWRSGRFSTLPERWILCVRAAANDINVHVSRNDGW